jgi:hypothetical protein
MEKFREQFKKEKDFTYWAEGCDYGSFNDNYVNWLEKKLALNIADVVVPKGTLCGCGAELIKDAVGIEYCGNTLCKHK